MTPLEALDELVDLLIEYGSIDINIDAKQTELYEKIKEGFKDNAHNTDEQMRKALMAQSLQMNQFVEHS